MKKKQPAPTSATGSLGTAGKPTYQKSGFCSYCLLSLESIQPGGLDPRHVSTKVAYGECVQAKRAKETELAHSQIPYKEATCTVCGCTDSKACVGGCWWETVDREAGTGVCSNCK
jgi:hypothetical protein